jgi:hypothetical protein
MLCGKSALSRETTQCVREKGSGSKGAQEVSGFVNQHSNLVKRAPGRCNQSGGTLFPRHHGSGTCIDRCWRCSGSYKYDTRQRTTRVVSCSLRKAPNQENRLVVSLLPVPLNASPKLSRDLSQFFASCSPDDFFDPGHPELTISGVDSFCNIEFKMHPLLFLGRLRTVQGRRETVRRVILPSSASQYLAESCGLLRGRRLIACRLCTRYVLGIKSEQPVCCRAQALNRHSLSEMFWSCQAAAVCPNCAAPPACHSLDA